MNDQVYRELARKIDSIPPGFAAAEDDSHLRVLEALYEPEEALLGSVMRPTPETAAAIAKRAGMDTGEADARLYEMARRMLIATVRVGEEDHYELMPWVVGVFEGQLPRMDRDLAQLFAAYGKARKVRRPAATGAGQSTPVGRVIPVAEVVDAESTILPHERAADLLSQAKSWGVRECICRKLQRFVDSGCDHELENCMVFSDRENVFADSDLDRAITLDEALLILHRSEEAGLVHSVGNYREEHEFICNCCNCCCGFIRGAAQSDRPKETMHTDFLSVVDEDLCVGCETCVDRCPTGALSVPEDVAVVDEVRCIGCGLCASVCPSDALSLVRRPDGEVGPVAQTRTEWVIAATEERGQPLDRPSSEPLASGVVQPPTRG